MNVTRGFAIGIVILGGMLLIARDTVAQPPAAEESALWYGEMEAGPRQFRFLIKVDTTSKANPKPASLTSLDEGGVKFDLNDFSLDKDKLSFKLKVTNAAYEGASDAKLKQVNGKWKQAGGEYELNFRPVSAAPVDRPQETWLGTLKAGFQNLDLQLRAYVNKDGTRAYYLDSLNQKAGGFKATATIDQENFRLEVPALRASYEGKLGADGKEIVGKWKQVVSMDLTWKRVDGVAQAGGAERKRPQHPKAPFPYDSREVTFSNASAKVDLAGTLTIPKPSRKVPLAVLVSGSGPQDRDETLLEHKPFWVIADYLARRGIAVLRYDDRGVGKSKGNFAQATTADFAQDASAAVAFARTVPEVDPQKIGIIGHSEGGLVAPMVASTDKQLAWIILLAGPGVNGEQILYSQGPLMIAAEGGSEASQQQQLRMQKLTFQSLKEVAKGGDKESKVQSVIDALLKDQPDVSADARTNVEQSVRLNWAEMEKPWFQFFVAHEPGPVLEKVKCPVLALNGALDRQVDPKLNLPKISEHLTKGGNTRFKVREFEGLNHLFQTCKTGGISEYELIEETIAPSVLTEIGDWIVAQ